MSSMRNRVFETSHRPSSRTSRRTGYNYSLPTYRRSYHSSNIPASGSITTTAHFDRFEHPPLPDRHSSATRSFRSVTPPSLSSGQPAFPYDAFHLESSRNHNITPRRTNDGARNYEGIGSSTYSARPTGIVRDAVSRPGSIWTSTHSTRPTETTLFRNNSLPRNGAYGHMTGSRYTEDYLSPETGHTLPPRNRSLSPTRRNNWTISRYSDNRSLPITNTVNDYVDNRRDRSIPSGMTVTDNRYSNTGTNVGIPVHRANDTGSVTNIGIPVHRANDIGSVTNIGIPVHRANDRGSVRRNSDSRIHFPETSFDYEIPRPVTFFTYSDDEDDRRNHREHENSVSPNKEDSDLIIKDIDCHVTENARDHHTERFAKSREQFLIVRRAQTFRISVNLNKRFSETDHEICMEFTTGPLPQPGKGTYTKLSTVPTLHSSDTWGIKIDSVMGNRVTVVIETSPEAIVGEWKMVASVVYRKGQENRQQIKKEEFLYLLFNPWDRGDCVYFPDKSLLSEYILNDSGCIFTGGYDQIAAKPWFYGQFESGVLEAAILCMNKAFKSRPRRAMGDPVRVSRAISKIVNSNDDSGVLSGNWSGNYRNGTAPLAWVGSVSILRQFMKSKMPVKYGQCFVFAGVVTTICRALGIPCRTVTNFSSAHDTDGSVTVDVHWDTLGNSEIPSLNTDSIWNFHVWNDVWMKRKDLPSGNDGWQVLDSTPQETSDGEFRCGPAPLTAILNGKCDVNYDTAFIYAEVNADRVHWGKQNDGNWQPINTDKSVVGKMISTKKADGLPLPDNFDDCEKFRDDITIQYKYLEGSERERMSVISAALSAPRGLNHVYTKDNDVKFKILTPKSVKVGSDFEIAVEFSNSSGVAKTLSGWILCEVTKYTGATVHQCKKEALNIEIDAYQQQRVVMNVSVDEYVDAVAEAAMFRFAMISRVKESGQQFAALETFRLRLPDLSVKIRDRFLRTGVPIDIIVSFDNPLKTRTLTNCLILAECPGMKDIKVFSTRNVLPGEQFQTSIHITPDTRGTCPLFMTFNCDQIYDIKGTCTLYVQ